MATARVLNMKGDPEQIIELAQLIQTAGLSENSRLRIQMTRIEALRLTANQRASLATTWLLAMAEKSNEPKIYADALLEAARLRMEEGQHDAVQSHLDLARKITQISDVAMDVLRS